MRTHTTRNTKGTNTEDLRARFTPEAWAFLEESASRAGEPLAAYAAAVLAGVEECEREQQRELRSLALAHAASMAGARLAMTEWKGASAGGYARLAATLEERAKKYAPAEEDAFMAGYLETWSELRSIDLDARILDPATTVAARRRASVELDALLAFGFGSPEHLAASDERVAPAAAESSTRVARREVA